MNYQIEFNRAAIHKLIKGQMEELSIDQLFNLLEANPQVIDIVVDKGGIRGGKVYDKQGKVIGLQG